MLQATFSYYYKRVTKQLTIHSILMALTLWNWKHKLIYINMINCVREKGEWIEMTENEFDWHSSINYVFKTNMNECKKYVK